MLVGIALCVVAALLLGTTALATSWLYVLAGAAAVAWGFGIALRLASRARERRAPRAVQGTSTASRNGRTLVACRSASGTSARR